ncbi:polysaccharide pyruvyl transferase family protein [Rothia nasimurium]|uniref:polysaccharide pyruvyl transferase family protein n=1 Tax=Rothia nasimurium TaxID=85336 RepID=UPI001F2EC786|nr:polysaccharide pyruvyl transferase family protein [Rothia nasimurium]
MKYYWSALPNRADVRAVKTFWWDREPNFGDLLTEYILPRYGIAPVLVSAEDAELVSVGSVLNMIGSNYSGAVFGSGIMHENQEVSLSRSQIYAVRGKLTKKQLDLGEKFPMGDPGILMSKILPLAEVENTGKIGFIPHYSHQDKSCLKNLWNAIEHEAIYIDVRKSPEDVASKIKSCETIFSTSLHGVILADSYGKPVVWSLPPEGLPGGDYKFRDYESVVLDSTRCSRRVEIDELKKSDDIRRYASLASCDSVSKSVNDLEGALEQLKFSLKKTNYLKVVQLQFEGPFRSLLSKIKRIIKFI